MKIHARAAIPVILAVAAGTTQVTLAAGASGESGAGTTQASGRAEELLEIRGLDKPVAVPRAWLAPPPTRKESSAVAIPLQFVGGTAATGALSVVALSMALCEYDCGDQRAPWLVLAAIPIASSAAVYGIGKGFDGAAGGSFGPTLVGGVIGTAAGIGLLAMSDGGPQAVAALAAPAAGAIIGYRLSLSRTSTAVVQLEGNQVTWSLPVPKPRVESRPSSSKASIGYEMELVRLAF